MKAWIGKSFLGIGVIHSVFGFLIGWQIIAVLFKEGLFNTVNGQPEREAIFWFFFTGFSLMIIGGVVDWLEREQKGIPGHLSWSFLAITLVGVVVMPASGFWLLLVPVGGLFHRQWVRRKKQRG